MNNCVIEVSTCDISNSEIFSRLAIIICMDSMRVTVSSFHDCSSEGHLLRTSVVFKEGQSTAMHLSARSLPTAFRWPSQIVSAYKRAARQRPPCVRGYTSGRCDAVVTSTLLGASSTSRHYTYVLALRFAGCVECAPVYDVFTHRRRRRSAGWLRRVARSILGRSTRTSARRYLDDTRKLT